MNLPFFYRRWLKRTGSAAFLAVFLQVVLLTNLGCKPKQVKIAADRPGIISGASMAPAFLGEHYRASCPRCEIVFNADRQQAEEIGQLVCPNCGKTEIPLSTTVKQPAQLVDINWGESPQRWQTVAFSNPVDGQAGIKRVAGLPGEQLQIRDGNLYRRPAASSPWEILVKPLPIQREIRVLVHDSKFAAGPRGWRGESPTSWSRLKNGSYSVNLDDHLAPPQIVHWLQFYPRRNYRVLGEIPDPERIEDAYGYNQSLSRELHAMDELMLELNLTTLRPTVLVIEYRFRGQTYRVVYDQLASEVSLQQQGDAGQRNRDLKTVPLESSRQAKPIESFRLEVSVFDQQLVLAENGNVLLDHPISAGRDSVAFSAFKIGVQRGHVQLDRIRLFRDLYYFDQDLAGTEQVSSVRTFETGDGYFLLGDNVPVSYDSRQWATPSVTPEHILGVVRRPENEAVEAF